MLLSYESRFGALRRFSGQLVAYKMDEECWFVEAYKLTSPGRTQYLLLGADKGDGQCDNFQARVVELKGSLRCAYATWT